MRPLLLFLEKKGNEIIGFYFFALLVFFVYPFDVENKVNTVKIAGTFRLDHILHVFIFLPSSFIIFNKFKFKLSYILLISIFLSVFFEFIQWFVPYRAFTFKDLQANIIGSIFGFALFVILKKRIEIIKNQYN
jgi:VanZ family protein